MSLGQLAIGQTFVVAMLAIYRFAMDAPWPRVAALAIVLEFTSLYAMLRSRRSK